VAARSSTWPRSARSDRSTATRCRTQRREGGVVALTRSLASEWGRHAIRVNAIGPAFFPTATAGYLQDPDQVEWIKGHTALKRPARIDELDGLIVFLASDASTFITGQHFLVDGGWSVY
jgi:gluconate 5-dehydrogenase